jgi:hypothetical protein
MVFGAVESLVSSQLELEENVIKSHDRTSFNAG